MSCARCGSLLLIGAGLWTAVANATEPIEFNPAFFGNQRGQTIDLSKFQQGNPLEPGDYQLDLYLNQSRVGRKLVRVRAQGGGSPGAKPCLPMPVLDEIGVNLGRLTAGDATQAQATRCLSQDDLPPSSRLDVDMADLRADLSIPQLYLRSSMRGSVPPEEWDAGINAGFLGYSLNLSSNQAAGMNRRQLYSSLNGGVNLGQWRFRHNGSFTYTDSPRGSQGTHYQSLSSYVQHDVTPLRAQFTMGQYYTPGNLFDSVPFTGVQVSSDERMLPDSMRGFAPVVRGVADTTAKVSVRQGNNLLYETTVSPGPFAIDDLNNTGYAGDLEVTITEADGRTKRFIVPYASITQLLRPGTSKFTVTGGRYRDNTLASPPMFVQGTYQRGLTDSLTGYGGIIAAQRYGALQGGLALSTPLGGLAADLTQSRASLNIAGQDDINRRSGRSVRLSYSKLLESTATNFSLAAFRFSSEGYLSFGDFARAHNSVGYLAQYKERSRLQVNVSQPLADGWGYVTLAGMTQDYWSSAQGRDTTFYGSYANSYAWGSFNLSVARTRGSSGRFDNQYLLSFSIPLGRGANSPYLNTSMSVEGQGNRGMNASITGSAGEMGEFGYSVYGSLDQIDGQRNNSQGGSLRYDASHASYSLSASRGEGYRQFGAGMRGTLVAHAGGLNATQGQGETIALLEAPDAEGAQIVYGARTRIGGNGYGVSTGLMPYRRNEIALDPRDMSRDVQLEMTSQQVAPRAGAVVLLKYPTLVGRPILLKLVREDGETIPLGAEVMLADGESVTLVGQGGRAFVRGLQGQGQMIVRWGAGADQQCVAPYHIDEPPDAADAYYQQLELSCRAAP